MCKRTVIGGFALLLLVLSFTATSAQTPYIAVFFGPNTEQAVYFADCPAFGTLDTLSVYLFNANALVIGVDFSIDYGNNVSWLFDFNQAGTYIGHTPFGFSMGWALPQNGFFPVFITNVMVQWICDGCVFTDDPIVVGPNPSTGDLAFVDFPAYNLFPALGLTALTCPTIANEQSTWGKVKALYEE